MTEQTDRTGRKRGSSDRNARQPGHRSQRRSAPTRFGAKGKPPALAEHYIYGLHAAEFALHNRAREIRAAWATENAERKLAQAFADRKLTVQRATPRDLDKRVGADTVHQGIVLEVAPVATVKLTDLAERSIATGQPILFLDQVTDPHNVGAVLRSGAVFGLAGIVMTQRHSPPLGGTLAKAASGALDLMPVCLVQNLAKALTELQGQSFTVIGLDGGSAHRLLEDGLAERHGQPLVLALGAEGRGLRELTRQTCDELCRIGGDGPIASLNVSNAAAIALHLAAMQRRQSA
ncbi:MAG: 23S rRNA (guanosine(2251)-2'-O)-methyltransferase RlmB [Hyphomicrobiaceae bacterium]